MTSSYALPTTAIPQFHHHSPAAHMHSHSNSNSHSPSTSLGSLHAPRSRKDSRARGQAHDRQDHGHSHGDDHDHDHDDNHDHAHDHDHDHCHGHSHSHDRSGKNGRPTRKHQPPPLAPSGHWRMESTPGGTSLLTPTDPKFDVGREYQPPTASKDHSPHGPVERSRFTSLVLPLTERWPLIHTVLVEKDSRRIFYFMSLNLGFMMVQAFYGYVTDSLGLLSDSIHMFFDCVALAVGLFAAVASKWPPSERFPYGFGKIETLSGFANGVFLILISLEIMFEACERIVEGRETKRLGELFVVSTMGLLVNLVGMMAFGHHHHGHDHGHSHGHSHGTLPKCNGDSHGHDNHDHDHDNHDHDHDHKHEKKGHSHAGHSHSHDNENMHGIYLHILADTLGSGAVIVSTILTHFWKWAGWDPLASFLIAVLILLSALPLVKSSARRLLLTIPAEVEYTLRETLPGISGLKGVTGYAVPKFWLDDRNAGEGAPANRLRGVIHIMAARSADMDDVRDRVRNYLAEHEIDVTLQVEREGDTTCWCGVGRSGLSGLSMSMSHKPKPSQALNIF
ncbi:cation efflux family-domain-containing protein [Podospora conica]|nr:cation efflux family-domain-containing protein [Schizothecium conicum]